MRLLVITSRFPYPLDKGDKLRAYHQIKYLAKNHEVLLCCLTDKPINHQHIKHLETFCKVKVFTLSKWNIILNLLLGVFTKKPFQVHYFYDTSIKKKIHKEIEWFKPQHIYCQLIRTTEYVKDLFEIPKTLDYMDAFSKGMERRFNHANSFSKPFIKAELTRLLYYENIIFDYFDNHTIISQQDRDSLYMKEKEKISIVKNGVDTDYFSPSSTEKKYDVCFVGNLNYPPNIKAAEFLANDVLPLLSKNIRLIISGANPHQKVKSLASENVKIQGWTDDIREVYNSSKLFVAPMFIGTGLQNKLLEAMAMQLPCVTTSLANNALNAEPNKEILIGNNPQEIANQIKQLLENNGFSNEVAKNGQQFVLKHYSWETQNEKLNEILMHKTLKHS